MKKIFVLSAVLYAITFIFTAEARINGKIRSYVNNTPRQYEDSLDTLVPYLVKPYTSDYDKAASIATWIASRIAYDEFMYNNGKATKMFKDRIKNSMEGEEAVDDKEDILISRVGTCNDYANLFMQMCQAAGIQAGIVKGYILKNKKRPEESMNLNKSHAWNYFIYNGEKIYVDTTFMAGGKLRNTTRLSEERRKKQMDKLEKINKKRSKIYPIRDYYFDFEYDKERRDFHYEGKEGQ